LAVSHTDDQMAAELVIPCRGGIRYHSWLQLAAHL